MNKLHLPGGNPRQTLDNSTLQETTIQLSKQFQDSLERARKYRVEGEETNKGRLFYPLLAIAHIDIQIEQSDWEIYLKFIAVRPTIHLLALYIMLGDIRDTDSDCLLLPNELLRTLNSEGIESVADAKNALMELGIEIETILPDYRVMQVTSVTLPPYLVELRGRVIVTEESSESVFLTDGSRPTQSRRTEHRKLLTDAYASSSESTDNPLIKLLHATPRGYRKLESPCQSLIRQLLTQDELSLGDERDLRILRNSLVQPQPQYHGSGKTPRIFARNGFVTLSRSMRKQAVELAGWISLDISASQLVIVHNVIGIPELGEYLADSSGTWQRILSELGLPLDEDHKAALKNNVYRIVFGGSSKSVEKDLNASELEKSISKQVFSHKLLNLLENRMQAEVNEVENIGFICDAFGNYYTQLGPKSNDHTLIGKDQIERGEITKLEGKEQARSLLSRKIQSYEYRILSQAILERHGKDDVQIRGWLHDEIILQLHSTEKRKSKAVEKIKLAVSEHEREIYKERGIKDYIQFNIG